MHGSTIHSCTYRSVSHNKQQGVTAGFYVLVGCPDPNINNKDSNIAYNCWFDYPLSSKMRSQPLERINVYAESNDSSINNRVDYF